MVRLPDRERVRAEAGLIWRHFRAGFAADNCAFAAGALTYTSLLSLVPLMAVTFSVLAAFPVFESVTADLQNFVFANFVPAAGEIVAEHLQSFAQKASQLTAAGIVFLVLTAVMLMANIDNALNAIFKVRSKRRLLASFLVYWAVLTLGPLLLGASLVMTSFLVSAPMFDDAAATVGGKARLLSLMPYVAATIAFALLYMVVPNRRVRWRHALVGGLLAAVLFEAAKRTFAWYVTSFPTYEAIYGALAAVPIFLIWIYLSWLVILIGAEFTYTLGSYRDHAADGGDRAPRFVLAFRLLRVLWQAQDDGQARTAADLSEALDAAPGRVGDTLDALAGAQVVAQIEGGRWILARDLTRYTLRDLYDASEPTLPRSRNLSPAASSEAFVAAIEEVGASLESAFGRPLATYFEVPPAPTTAGSAG